jgi:hypothetical protein
VCPSCNSQNLVVVNMTLKATPVQFAHCRACEHRWWLDVSGDRVLALDEVLDRAAA